MLLTSSLPWTEIWWPAKFLTQSAAGQPQRPATKLQFKPWGSWCSSFDFQQGFPAGWAAALRLDKQNKTNCCRSTTNKLLRPLERVNFWIDVALDLTPSPWNQLLPPRLGRRCQSDQLSWCLETHRGLWSGQSLQRQQEWSHHSHCPPRLQQGTARSKLGVNFRIGICYCHSLLTSKSKHMTMGVWKGKTLKF